MDPGSVTREDHGQGDLRRGARGSLVCVSPRLQQACQRDLGQGDRGLWPYGSSRWVARWGVGVGSSSPGVKEKVTGPEFKVGASSDSAYGSPYTKLTLAED